MSIRFVAAVALITLACASARRDARAPIAQPASSGRGDTVIEHPTSSAALDRISKRAVQPDGMMRHSGTGRGTSIYVFDGGISAMHPELAGRVRAGFDAFAWTARVCNQHGTAVAGAAAGATLGVAPSAEIVDVKIINCDTGRGTVGAILEAARWVVQDHRAHADRPAVANWSFIVDTLRVVPQIDSAVTLLANAGILVVASAGNSDVDACRVWPATAHHPLVVGASSVRRGDDGRARDVRTPYTAWGSCVDVYAPGDSVPLPAMDRDQPRTLFWTGTSMAAGYASGAVALLLETHPEAGPRSLIRTIRLNATVGAVDQRVEGNTDRGRLLYVGAAERSALVASITRATPPVTRR
jgi:subtilisin family serine protease